MSSVNQTVYYTAANTQILQALGTVPNVTHTFISPTWPPKDPKIIYNATTPGTGILGAIPVRYANDREFIPSNGSGSGTTVTRYTAQTFLPFQDQAAVDQAVVEMITRVSSGKDYDFVENMPFGAVAFDALNPAQSNVKMTMQFGSPPVSEYGDSVKVPTGLRQMIMMTQISNAVVKTKFAGQYVISQGLRALPYEWPTDSFKGYNLNRMSAPLFPFALSFLLPTFVSIMVQEKEDRHRMMMAMVRSLVHWGSFLEDMKVCRRSVTN